MSTNDHPDFLDENLRTIGRRLRETGEPTPELLDRCMAEFDRPARGAWRMIMKKYKRPVLFSGMSLAASVALFATILWPSADPNVYARITDTLARQSKQNPLVHVRLESLSVDELTVDGELHVGPSGLAGNVSVTIQDNDGPLTVDAAIAVVDDGGWVLVRKLVIPDPQAQAIISLLLPPGQETLILLPKGSDIAHEVSGDVQEALSELQSGELIGVFKELIESHAEYGATVEQQADGTTRLVLHIKDEEALEALARLADRIDKDGRVEIEVGVGTKEHTKKGGPHDPTVRAKREVVRSKAVDSDDGAELIGATLSAVFDPATETVRMLSLSGLGDANGAVTVTLGDGDIDPALLDSGSVAKPGTRTLDATGLGAMLEGLVHENE